jgi:ankyrin repeat protein
VLKDCCPNEGPLPAHADPELVKHHVRGPVSWIKDNPGRQMIGSFNPITEGDWMEGAMLSEHVSDLIAAACSGDAAKLAAFLSEHPDIDINARDRFGRTPLLVAALVGSADCVKLCLDRGASLTQKMPDGRTALHIAAAYGWEGIVLLVASRAGDQLPALVNAVDERSMTPLYWAIALGQVTLAGLLVDAGAHANVSPTASTSSRFNQNVAATEVQDEHMHPFLFTMHLPALSEDLAR